MTRRLALADIADVRAYERERESFRASVIALKRRRRVALGPVVSVVFEHRDTVRFQIQEMARIERLMTDAAIEELLDTYSPMIPESGRLCATVFIETTSPAAAREWLPKLVGLERHLTLRLGDGDEVRGVADERAIAQHPRADVAAAVHVVRFVPTNAQVTAFGPGAVLASDHPAYPVAAVLAPETVEELQGDLAGGPAG